MPALQQSPIPNAELPTLDALAGQVPGVDLANVIESIQAQGIEVRSPHVLHNKLAEVCNITQAQLCNSQSPAGI